MGGGLFFMNAMLIVQKIHTEKRLISPGGNILGSNFECVSGFMIGGLSAQYTTISFQCADSH